MGWSRREGGPLVRFLTESMRNQQGGGIPRARVEDPALQRQLDALAEAVERLTGARNGLDTQQAVRFQDLIDNDFAVNLEPQYLPGHGNQESLSRKREIRLPQPEGLCEAPENLTASVNAAAHVVSLSWDHSGENVEFYEVWQAASNDRDTAYRIDATLIPRYRFVQDINGRTMYYWVRARSTAGANSEFNAGVSGGVSATT